MSEIKFLRSSLKMQPYYRIARLSGKAPGKFYPPKPSSDDTPMLNALAKKYGTNALNLCGADHRLIRSFF